MQAEINPGVVPRKTWVSESFIASGDVDLTVSSSLVENHKREYFSLQIITKGCVVGQTMKARLRLSWSFTAAFSPVYEHVYTCVLTVGLTSVASRSKNSRARGWGVTGMGQRQPLCVYL